MLADHPERQVVVALHPQDVAKTVDVLDGELPIAGGRALGLDQPLVLEEADLRDRHPGEVGAQDVEDLPDVVPHPGRGGRVDFHAPRHAWGAAARSGACSWPWKNTRRYLPICTSSVSLSTTVSMR